MAKRKYYYSILSVPADLCFDLLVKDRCWFETTVDVKTSVVYVYCKDNQILCKDYNTNVYYHYYNRKDTKQYLNRIRLNGKIIGLCIIEKVSKSSNGKFMYKLRNLEKDCFGLDVNCFYRFINFNGNYKCTPIGKIRAFQYVIPPIKYRNVYFINTVYETDKNNTTHSQIHFIGNNISQDFILSEAKKLGIISINMPHKEEYYENIQRFGANYNDTEYIHRGFYDIKHYGNVFELDTYRRYR